MKTLEVLIVEDEDNIYQEQFVDVIDDFNDRSETHQIIYKEHRCKDVDSAREKIQSQYFDAAIVDLKLSKKKKADEAEGNKVILEILDKARFPVVVYSNQITTLDPEIRERESDFLLSRMKEKVRVRDLIDEIIAVYDTGITNILGGKGDIEKYLNEIFWNHLSNSISFWKKHNNERTLLRYVIAHLHEHLELNNDSEFEHYNPAEIYITPPIKQRPYTGMIVSEKDSSHRFVLLSPPCDCAQGKAQMIVMAKIDPLKKVPAEGLKKKITRLRADIKAETDKDKVIELEEQLISNEIRLKRFISNSESNTYHFLPATNGMEGGYINFQKVTACKPSDFEKCYTPIASITSSFLKDIIARFSYYYSRQGAPDLDIENIFNDYL